ncbi:MAG: hypothetical protein HC910_18050 [Spirulinaceae cyanobacterium SM2_1_0]|nr:hypothetical protein [Spirulinaceae cyanobacterium SM2_1_0]
MTVALMAPLSEIELSPGSAIALPGLTWQHHQLALAELDESRATRLAHSQGVLEMRIPSPWHEIISGAGVCPGNGCVAVNNAR